MNSELYQSEILFLRHRFISPKRIKKAKKRSMRSPIASFIILNSSFQFTKRFARRRKNILSVVSAFLDGFHFGAVRRRLRYAKPTKTNDRNENAPLACRGRRPRRPARFVLCLHLFETVSSCPVVGATIGRPQSAMILWHISSKIHRFVNQYLHITVLFNIRRDGRPMVAPTGI